MEISDLLKESVERRASDLHLTAGIPPTLRIDGKLTLLDGITDLEEMYRVVANF